MNSTRAGPTAAAPGPSGLELQLDDPYAWIVGGLWCLVLVAIPVTSFPALAETLGSVTVLPLSLFPLLPLTVIWLLPDLWQGGRLPFFVWPLLLFCAVSVLAAGAAWFLHLEPFKGQTVLAREARALVTLGVGIAFYFCAARFPTNSRRRRLSLAALYLGGAATLVWSTVQADYILEGLNNVPQELNEFHRLFSIRDLDRNRATGFAFEPSWLGDQLVVLYLPIWLAGVLSRESLVPRKWGPLALELPLLLWGGWILLMTRSRVSVLAVLVMVGVLLLLGLWRLGGWLSGRLQRAAGSDRGARSSNLIRAFMVLVGIGIMSLLAYALLVQSARVDSRMRRALSIPSQLPGIVQQYPYSYPYEIANRFAVAERIVYWEASLHPFRRFPLLGVGPGNAGFLFEEGVPSYGYRLGEIRAYLDAEVPVFPNPKNLWIRLLSETGVVGSALYLTWLVLLSVLAWRARQEAGGDLRWLGGAALLSLAAQAVEGFSLDSFALPQVWVMNGLFTAAVLERLRQPTGGAERR